MQLKDKDGREITGRRLEILKGTSGLTKEKVAAYFQRWSPITWTEQLPDELKWMKEGVKSAPGMAKSPSFSNQTSRRNSGVHPIGVGFRIKQRLSEYRVTVQKGSGCKCSDLAMELDQRGVDWCDDNREIVARKLVENGDRMKWSIFHDESPLPALLGMAGNWAAKLTPHQIKFALARQLVDAAIEDVRSWPKMANVRLLANRGVIGVRYHRSGWPYAFSAIKAALDVDGNVLFDDFVEQTWIYNKRRTPIHNPWIGIFHHPPNPPAWTARWERIDELQKKEAFRKSLKNLKLAICLSHHLGDWVQKEWGVPVAVIKHPTEIPPESLHFNLKKYVMDPTLVQIGWYMRNTRFIHQVPKGNYVRLCLLNRSKGAISQHDHRVMNHTSAKEHPGVRYMRYIHDRDYDALLTKSVVVTNVLDASANNVVIECIARNTPIVINPHPAVVEYLGKDYPLYTEDPNKVPSMLDVDLLKATTSYLKEMDKSWMDCELFMQSVVSCVQSVIC